MNASAIPVTVIGGYLGAGKTTLVNRILTGDHGRRIAVIVNDFGDVAVDADLIGEATGGVRALANGCVCCSAVDGLATAIDDIAALEHPPEHLLIEVSGVGDPWAVAQWGRVPGFQLDGVVVVADPGAVHAWADDRYVGDTVRQQIAAADLLIVSRSDVLEPRRVSEVRRWLSDLSAAPILTGPDIALDVLLGPTRAGRAPHQTHAHHVAGALVPTPASRDDLERWLAAGPPAVVRVKGFVPVLDATAGEALLAVQRVGRRVEVIPVRGSRNPDPVLTYVAVADGDVTGVDDWWGAFPLSTGSNASGQ